MVPPGRNSPRLLPHSTAEVTDLSRIRFQYQICPWSPAMQDAANLMREFAQNGASGSSGRPSMPEPFAVHIAHWLREDPDVSGAEILRYVRRVGYHGGKSAP